MAARSNWWYFLLILRLLLTLWPQHGYIHPDEFFQSVEIATGDIFGMDTVRTWEFNGTFPVRSIVPLYLITGSPLMLLKVLQSIGIIDITFYSILVMPRIFMLLLSFVVDLCVFRVLKELGWNGNAGLLVVASSYVTIVYYTRTFSNSFEAILFAALLLETILQKVPPTCSSLNSINSSAVRIAFVIITGLFNRPTFAAYAAVPYVFWLFFKHSNITFDRLSYAKTVFLKAFLSMISVIFFTLLFVICDSIYFGRLLLNSSEIASTIERIGFSTFLLQNFTLTPLNFLVYNCDLKNLSDHGLHPRYLHLVVNVQILFCFLGLLVSKDLISLISLNKVKRKSLNLLELVIQLSFVVPLISLSAFPHQEPRFLIPLLCPLAILSSTKIFGKSSSQLFKVLWIIFNVFGCIFYGFFHQGGIIPAISRMHVTSESSSSSASHTINVIFWRTYMPPRHLFLQYNRHAISLQQTVYQVHDLAGASKEVLIKFLTSVNRSSKSDTLLVSPGMMHHQVLCIQHEVKVLHKLWPHFSGEDLPSIDYILCQKNEQNNCSQNTDGFYSFTKRLFDATTLYLYNVTIK